jgi:uncharacterized protein with ParB-like and HNH nuclease domain
VKTGISFEAKNKTLKEVLFALRRFRVPRFQRPYAWRTSEVSALWDDLIGAIDENEPYFLGSIICNTEHETEVGAVDIIDGQQRLLTITILSAVLRDSAKTIDGEKSKLYQRHDIATEHHGGGLSFRIQPAESVASFFEVNIQNENGDIANSKPRSPEEKRVKENYLFLAEKVGKYISIQPTKETKLARLDSLREMVRDLVVISVEISREEDAYEIFESTNDRGLDLSVADLLKNLIFQNITPGKNQDFAKDTWGEMNEEIESTNTELRKFIRYFWISKYEFLPEKKLFHAIKNEISNWQQLLSDLAESSKLYTRMLVGTEQDFMEYKHGVKIYESLFSLRLMGVSQCYVLLLSIFRNYKDLGTAPTRIIQFIEKFSFKYSAICKQPTNRVEKLYSGTAIKLDKLVAKGVTKHTSGEVQGIFSDLEKALKELNPSEQLFVESFDDLCYRDTNEGRRMIKYVLGRINSYLNVTDEQKIDFNTVNIEHVLPQRPQKDWKLKRSEIKGYVNMVGNLTLVSKEINSTVQNAVIALKLPELEKSELAITKELVKILKLGAWNEERIRERHRDLAQVAYREIWN